MHDPLATPECPGGPGRALLLLLPLLALTTSSGDALGAGETANPSDLAVIEERILVPLRASTGRPLSYPGAEHLAQARVLIAKGETKAALAALDAWLDLDYRHSNWWVNHVPIPRAVGEIALLVRDDLGEARRARVNRVLRRAWPPPRGGIGVGANLFYRTDAAVLQALLARDEALLRSIFERAAAEIRITRQEGIQEDLSFHQHGPQFYTGSYGLEFIRGAVRIATLGHGTGLALPREKMDLLLALLLDGLQWIVQGPTIDPGAQGRNFSRTGAGRGGRAAAGFCEQILALDPPRRAELNDYAKSLRGNRCFWRSDFMVHRRPGWYVSTKMVSLRTVGTESGNGEGLMQYHMADGACIVLRRGDEYDGIQPVWNWRQIPGTTCRQVRGPLPLVNWGRGARGTTRFVGGASDGEHGIAVMRLDRAGVRAHKAWFYLDDQVVCLGAAIRADGEETVVTTLDQCLARTPVQSGERWVHHDGVGYVVMDGRLEARVETQRGSWKSINRSYAGTTVERSVFTARIDHRPKPREATYAYVLLPGATSARTAAWGREPTLRILANASDVQAVRHDALGLTGIVFHAPGTVAGVTVDRPCVILIRAENGGTRLSVADPAQRNEPIRVNLAGQPEPLDFRPRDGRTQTRLAAR